MSNVLYTKQTARYDPFTATYLSCWARQIFRTGSIAQRRDKVLTSQEHDFKSQYDIASTVTYVLLYIKLNIE